MQLQKTNNLPPTLRKLSQTELCSRIAVADFKGVSDNLPKTIQDAIGSPRINDLVSIHGKAQVRLCVEYELIKTNALVSVGNKLNDAQVQFIATQLLEFFPNETLADFKICFERGCIGQYGEIFRLDGIVIRKWMEQYLDEKYQVVETNLMNEKDNPYQTAEPEPKPENYKVASDESAKEWLRQWREEVEKAEGNKTPAMSREDILKWGQSEPPKRQSVTSGYRYFWVKNLQVMALTQEQAEEIVRKMIASGDIEEVEDVEHDEE
jgi:hypothetical protein